MKNVMIDFEAFGNGKHAAVCQVGACYFDMSTGEIGDTFSANIDAESAVKSGGVIDGNTIYWWLKQSQEARESLVNPAPKPVEQVFTELNLFLKHADSIWSHATYDFVLLTETLKRLGIKPSFHYRVARDIRTLICLTSTSVSKVERTGLHHNGLADAMHQVKYCVIAMNKLRGRHEKN